MLNKLFIRPNTSDQDVFYQIFVQREYACLDDLEHVRLVVDCGANVGYASVYFLSRFQGCKVIAVEPDPGNFEVLRANLASFGSAAQAICGAVWSHPCTLKISDTSYRDGRHWTKQVQECEPDTPGGFPALDIGCLLADSGHERISLLKMDIEGAEAVVFSHNFEAWLKRVDNIVIELHDDSHFGNATEIFMRAIDGQGFSLSQFGELTVCRRKRSHSSFTFIRAPV